jgi:hypothetical protein
VAIKCDNCNAPCCRQIGKVRQDLDRGDGACIHLDDNCKCKIYEHRPLICDTDRLYNAFFKGIMPREEYDKLNADGCRKLRESNYWV